MKAVAYARERLRKAHSQQREREAKNFFGLFEKLYEDNVEGKVTDEWFMRLSNKYEVEQEELKRHMFELQEKLDKIDPNADGKGRFSPSYP